MKKAYTVTESTQDGAIAVSYDNTGTAIILQEYSEEKYKEFLTVLRRNDSLS